jgi:hypothetical protein
MIKSRAIRMRYPEIDPMTLFALTAEDIAAIRAARAPRPCKGCGIVTTMRPNQQYCTTACRTRHSPAHKKSRPPIILNELSRAELAALTPDTEHKCLWCAKYFRGKPIQSFCSLKCKNMYSNAASAILLERLQVERAHWLDERESLIREVAALRARLAALIGPDLLPSL